MTRSWFFAALAAISFPTLFTPTAMSHASPLVQEDTLPLRIPVYESYRLKKIPYTLDVSPLSDTCTPYRWEQKSQPLSRHQNATWSPTITVTNCNDRPVRINEWSFVLETNCSSERAFSYYKLKPIGRLSQLQDVNGTIIDVLPGVEITTCYDEKKTPVRPLDCQGKWYNKPTWRFAYNVTLPHDAVKEPEACGRSFLEILREKTKWQVTSWICESVGASARILVQTEPLTHHRWIHAAVNEYGGGEYHLDRDGPIHCPYFNQAELPPTQGHCSDKRCPEMKFKDFRTGEVF